MKVIQLIFIIIFCSCSGDAQRELVGTWKVKNYNLWEKGIAFLKGVRFLEGGHELTLNGDSSYREQSCGTITIGSWVHKGDSIILNGDKRWYRNAKWYIENRNNSYDSIIGIYSHSRTAFVIEKNKLVKISNKNSYSVPPDGSKKLMKGYSLTILK